MKNKIIYSAITFVLVFLITLWLTLPYSKIVAGALKNAERQAKIDIRYSEQKSGPLSTTFSDVAVNEIPVGDVKISYSPFRLITGSVGYKTAGAVNLKGKLSSGRVTAKGTVSSGLINNLTDKVSFNGDVLLDMDASLKDGTMSMEASADKASIDTPMGPMAFEKITAAAQKEKNKITLTKLASEDSMKLDLKGEIRVNNRTPEKSVVSITGTFDLMGQTKKLVLQGRADNITPSIR
ncbi:hypothetical protein Dacet_0480 [Denitrovibrio acetiphilus DSM 12809]|uniref:Uncharacterized protein n=1 Tax=Denitrovibrio acetiphilus (strain DSM 12809 / NBRC 114555 / N2460) TaxID=522772 RepID=D4H3W7_DENA2|nr:hypothetical protein [Denitrovibrio acetiphilus]ADD67278.1 hypothetical protein Dacet_0480 [Denitrovibrio acetiphilus DSM 12809]